MMYRNEQQILNIIKYTPPIFIITISIIISVFLYSEKQETFEKEKQQIKSQFIRNNKILIKQDVDELYDFIKIAQENMENDLKKNIKEKVYEAHKIATKIYNENKDKKSVEEIKKMIKDVLGYIKFNQGRGYYFIYSMDDYKCILLPTAKELEGTSFYNFKDGKGEYITRKIVKQVKKEKEGFLTWYYFKPENLHNQYKKIGFNIYFEPFNWFIGTGEYVEDYEKVVKEKVLNYVERLSSTKINYNLVLDYQGNILIHNKKDSESFTITNSVKSELINIAKLGDGYISHKKGENLNNDSIKTSYVKGFDQWKWVIIKNFYQDEINELLIQKEIRLNKRFNENMMVLLNISLILTLILLVISVYISKLLRDKFNKYRKDIQNHINKNTKQQNMLSQQAKMAAMGEMLGNIAHQWRQPLSLITTAASGMKMQKEFDSLDDETFEQSIENITNSAQYLSKTIDDFRNFFKTDNVKSDINIKDVLEKTLKLTNAQYKANQIDLIQDVIDYEIYGVENELVQALINILNNSKDILITKKYDKQILIKSYKDNNKGILEIIDNGGGIDNEILEKVFEPYFTTKHQSQGTGIGLYMTEEIIKKHFQASVSMKNKEVVVNGKEYKGVETRIIFNLE